MGDIPLEIKDWSQVEQNPFFCPDPDKIDALDELMRALKKRATPSARKSPLLPVAFLPDLASRSLTAWMPTSPMR